jgi:hypothetical protein
MRKISSLLFLAILISFVSCKDSKTAETSTTEPTSTEAPAAATDVTAPATTDATATTAPATTTVPTTASSTPASATPAGAPSGEPSVAVPTGPITTIEFPETTYDYGTVEDGKKVVHIYKFKNTGKNPLIISDAKGSCGCTVPEWPKEPIAPGKSGEIRVEFDSKNKGTAEGSAQSKRVTLTANTDPVQTYLTIKGIVKSAAK